MYIVGIIVFIIATIAFTLFYCSTVADVDE